MDYEDSSLAMAHALFIIFMESEDAELVRTAAAPLFNTEAGQLFMKQNPIRL